MRPRRTCRQCGRTIGYLEHLDVWAHLCMIRPDAPRTCPQCNRSLDDEAGHEACVLFGGDQ